MRELSVRLRFTEHCLGNVKAKDRSGRFLLPRSPQGHVVFLASWHHANLRLASRLFGKHHDLVERVCWDICISGEVDPTLGWFRRYYRTGDGKQRYVLHEAFLPGQEVVVHCAVPSAIIPEDFASLMRLAGQYRGLSPWKPGEFGFFTVESVIQRQGVAPETSMEEVVE